MPCTPCWQQRQLFLSAMRQGNPWLMAQAVRQGAYIATDKYVRGVAPRNALVATKRWACPICRTDLAWPQPVAPSCPRECPLRDPTTIPISDAADA